MWSLKPGKTEESVIIFGCISNQGLYRFLIQNSRLFPDSRLSNRWSIETLKKCRNKAFSMTCRRDLIRFDQQEKNFTCESLLFQKKRKKPFLQTSIFQPFSRSGKLLDKFLDFFKNLRLCTNPEEQIKKQALWASAYNHWKQQVIVNYCSLLF